MILPPSMMGWIWESLANNEYTGKSGENKTYKVSDSWSILSAAAAIGLNISGARHCIWITYGCIPMNFSKPCLNPFIILASTASRGNDLTVQLCNNTEKYFLLFILNSLPDNFIVYVSSWVPVPQEIRQVFPVLYPIHKCMQLSYSSKLSFPRWRGAFNLVSLHMENILHLYQSHCLSVLFYYYYNIVLLVGGSFPTKTANTTIFVLFLHLHSSKASYEYASLQPKHLLPPRLNAQ